MVSNDEIKRRLEAMRNGSDSQKEKGWRICPACNAENSENVKFCIKCNKNLEETIAYYECGWFGDIELTSEALIAYKKNFRGKRTGDIEVYELKKIVDFEVGKILSQLRFRYEGKHKEYDFPLRSRKYLDEVEELVLKTINEQKKKNMGKNKEICEHKKFLEFKELNESYESLRCDWKIRYSLMASILHELPNLEKMNEKAQEKKLEEIFGFSDLEKQWIDIKNIYDDLEKLRIDIKNIYDDLEKKWIDIKNIYDDLEKKWIDIKNIYDDLEKLRIDIRNKFDDEYFPDCEKKWIDIKNIYDDLENIKNIYDDLEKQWIYGKNLFGDLEKNWIYGKNLFSDSAKTWIKISNRLNELNETYGSLRCDWKIRYSLMASILHELPNLEKMNEKAQEKKLEEIFGFSDLEKGLINTKNELADPKLLELNNKLLEFLEKLWITKKNELIDMKNMKKSFSDIEKEGLFQKDFLSEYINFMLNLKIYMLEISKH